MPSGATFCLQAGKHVCALLLCLNLAGCNLANKKGVDLAQKPLEPQLEDGAPVILASEARGQGESVPQAARPGESAPSQPHVIPAGAIDPRGAAPWSSPLDASQVAAPAESNSTMDLPPVEGKVWHATTDDFQDLVLESNDVVLVDFYADWCGPCKKQTPILEQYARKTPEVRVVKVNTEKSRRVAKTYGIKRLPTLMVFRDGKPVDQQSGLVNETDLQKLVTRAATQ